MLTELFDQLAAAIEAAEGIRIYEVRPIAEKAGMELIDESDGSDLNLEYANEDEATDERLALEYLMIPGGIGVPIDQSFSLTLSRQGQTIREKRWESVDGLLVEVD